jgi:5,10-methylenetetrahydromethanopterin reductase
MTTRPAYSVALPPSREVTEHARAAAELGYSRVWVFDSPALYGDVWVALARIAESVEGIGLATGVAVPSLRHPMVTAAAIATVEELAPGRLWAYFGTGFTARARSAPPRRSGRADPRHGLDGRRRLGGGADGRGGGPGDQ